MNSTPQETVQEAARRLAASALGEGYKATGLHCYRDASGHPVFWRIRCKHPDGRKWIRAMCFNGSEYVLGESPAPAIGKPLYRLPELVAADPAALVWIVEGEGKADALGKLGLIVTTSGSCTSAGGTDWQPMAGHPCVIWPDNDKPGSIYADNVAATLRALGCPVERIDVAALELPDKGDASDWLALHPGATAADVLALARLPDRTAPPFTDSRPRVILTRGSEVEPIAVDWLWPGYLAAGKLHLIAGAPGTGKTTIAAALAATITCGGHWPDGSKAERGSVVFWSGEDDNADTLNPRLRAAGADMSRVLTVDGIQDLGVRCPFDPARDLEALRGALATSPDVRLIVIDPLVSAITGDSHKNAEVRRGLQPLVDMAGQLRCALLGVTHFSKGTGGRDPVERVTGSIAFGALPRLVMVTAKQRAAGDRPERRIMVRAKSNHGPDGDGFAYELKQGELPGYEGICTSSVLWGEAIHGTARELLAEAEQQDEPSGGAASLLRDLLANGPRWAKEIESEAKNAGFSLSAMHRAKRRIGAKAKKVDMARGWRWWLPGTEDRAEGCVDGTQAEPPSSPSSTAEPPASQADREVIRL